jgi:predicted RNA-binding Zn ribbon-like protein
MDDEQLAAPGELEHLRQFVNTRDLELGTDTLHTWFGDPADLERAVAIREAFRALLLSNATGEPPPAAALAVIDGERATLRVDGDLRLVPAGRGADAALARLLAIAVVAHADGTWQRLKACPGESCHWALYDRTRSRTRTWCAAAKCGARTRSREYRRRRAAR